MAVFVTEFSKPWVFVVLLGGLFVIGRKRVGVAFGENLVRDFGVVINPPAEHDEGHDPCSSHASQSAPPAKCGIAEAMAPGGLTSARPQQDAGYKQQNAKRCPVEREPSPGFDVRRVTEKIRVGHIRL